MSQATKQLAEKENYHELTEKQRAVIDAYAMIPEGSDTEIHEAASEILSKKGDSVARAYVPVILNKYPQIAYEQKHRRENGREEGEEVYEGVPAEMMEEKQITIPIELTREETEAVFESQLPNEFKNKLIDSILEATFPENS